MQTPATTPYAAAEAEEDDPDNKARVLARHPAMDSGTRMAFSFIAETIHRDTVKWRAKQERYRLAAEKRWAESQDTL